MYKRLLIQIIICSFLLLFCNYQINAQSREKIINKVDSLIQLLPTQKEDSIKAETIRNIATLKIDLAQHTGNWNDPIEWNHKALSLSIKTNYKWGIGRCYWQLGVCWTKAGNYLEAIKYFNEGLKTAFKNENQMLAIVCYSFMSDCYMNLGKYDEAIRICKIAIENSHQKDIQEVANNNAVEENCSMKIGNAYAKLKNYTEAMIWYEKVLKKHRAVSEYQIRLAMASVQMETKIYDDALKNYLSSLQFLTSRKKMNEKPESEYNGHLGNLYAQIGEVYYKIGSIRQDSSSIQLYKEAINYLDKSVPLLKAGAGGIESLMNAYDLLKKSCEAVSDYQNAMHYSNLYTHLKDSLYNKETYARLSDLEVKYKTEKAAAVFKIEQEKEKLKNDALMANQKLEDEQRLNDQKLAQQKQTAETNAAYEKSLVAEKEKQEKIRAEKQQINNLLLMGLILVVMASVFLFFYLRQRTEKIRAVEKAESIRKISEMELQSLRSQLNPHFMFNSLNSIQTLIMKQENEKSQSYLSQFARLLRMMLENTENPFIPLQKEIDFLQLYLALESLRMPDMQYSISIDPLLNAEKILIPNMILQPYAENAIWHGLSHKENDKQLQIRVSKENGSVNYEIEDNGVGRKKAGELKSFFSKQHQSKGMELISKRINLLNKEYSSTISTEITDVVKNNEVAGTLVSIKIPVIISQPFQN